MGRHVTLLPTNRFGWWREEVRDDQNNDPEGDYKSRDLPAGHSKHCRSLESMTEALRNVPVGHGRSKYPLPRFSPVYGNPARPKASRNFFGYCDERSVERPVYMGTVKLSVVPRSLKLEI